MLLPNSQEARSSANYQKGCRQSGGLPALWIFKLRRGDLRDSRLGVFVLCRTALNKPFDRCGKRMDAGLVAKLDRHENNGTTLRCKLGGDPGESLRRGARGGRY